MCSGISPGLIFVIEIRSNKNKNKLMRRIKLQFLFSRQRFRFLHGSHKRIILQFVEIFEYHTVQALRTVKTWRVFKTKILMSAENIITISLSELMSFDCIVDLQKCV